MLKHPEEHIRVVIYVPKAKYKLVQAKLKLLNKTFSGWIVEIMNWFIG